MPNPASSVATPRWRTRLAQVSLRTRLLVLVWLAVFLTWTPLSAWFHHDTREEVGELLDTHLQQSAALLADLTRHATIHPHDEDDDATERHPSSHKRSRAGDRESERDARTASSGEDETPPEPPQALPTGVVVPPASNTLDVNRAQLSQSSGFQVWRDGTLLRYARLTQTTPPQREGFDVWQQGEQAWRIYALPITQGWVVVGERIEARREVLHAIMDNLNLVLLAGLAALSLALVLAVRAGLAPLRRIGALLRARQSLVGQGMDSLRELPLTQTPREVQPLVVELNALFRRVAQLLEQERRFTADAAHELRTPIAAMRAHAQVALGALGALGAPGDPATLEISSTLTTSSLQTVLGASEQPRQALLAVIEACDRATHLVEQLLQLARLEAQPMAAQQPFNLADTARQVLAELSPDYLARGQELSLQAPDHLNVTGNALLASVLLRNLLDNAVRYSPPGARIAVTLEPAASSCASSPSSSNSPGNSNTSSTTSHAGTHDTHDTNGTNSIHKTNSPTPDAAHPSNLACLRIEDSGPGLSESERARLGERFFRVLGTQTSGSGLGWSIVRRIAALHHWQISLAPSPTLGGLCVTVMIPVEAS